MRLNPVLEELRSYPFLALGEAKRRLQAAGVDVIDFGVGEPREPTPAFIRQALVDAIEPLSPYPAASGLPELRAAIAGWVERRFGVGLDAETQVIPTLGAKEAIFHLDQVLGPGPVAVTVPGYPVAARGARFAGREVVELAIDEAGAYLPDLAALPADLALLWLNYPNNPTAATAPLAFLREAAALARERGFVLAGDEAYSELYFGDEPPASVLQVGDLTNVVAVNTLSKRSSMPGFRSGFVAGDPVLVDALRRYRPNVGVAPQLFVQRAAIAAYGDETHVEAVRAVYRAKRDVVLPALLGAGFAPAGGDASFFLWLRAPDERALAELLELGVVLADGALFGPAGAGCARVALVPTLEECERAAERISRWRAARR